MAERWKTMLQERGDLFMVGGVCALLLLMVLPVPPFILDIMLVVSLSSSILVLLLAIYAAKPLDFSVFPSVLLFSTLLRLTLNVASTRLILLHGGEGESAAGEVIRAFGHFVIGGNYVVGFVVFLILIVINFVVVTKGAGRIAEVAARFTLDSLPGKQLAIDADLNAGHITEGDARKRREQLQSEADFYGAMDGASKFVRGDAVAGILVTIVNVVGGFVIGIAQQGLSLSRAAQIYTALSVGDGLVAQIPALIVSTAAGIIVTKVSKQSRLSEEISVQAFGKWRPLAMASAIVGAMALVPGLPMTPFLLLAGLMGWQSYRSYRGEGEAALSAGSGAAAGPGGSALSAGKESVSQQEVGVPPLDILEVEVGYELIPLVDQRAGGEFPARIMGMRRQFANEMGLVLPPVHIRDNLRLKPNEYRIFLKGAVVGKGTLMVHHSLALDPGYTTRRIEGIPTVDPAFGIDALWVPDDRKESAIVAGYTVVDLPSVMATHLIEIVRRNLHDLYGRQELQNALDRIKQHTPKLVTDLVPDLLPFGTVLRVLQNLLRERVSIRDLVTILETLASHAIFTKDVDELTEKVRVGLGRVIAQQHAAADEQLYAVTLDRGLEEKLVRSLVQTQSGAQLAVDPTLAKMLMEQLGGEVKRHIANNHPPVVLTSQQVRPHLYRLAERFIPNLAVLSHSEVAGHVPVRPVGMVQAA